METFLLTSLKCSNPFGSRLPCIESIEEKTAITVGNFDGFHKGHKFLVSKLVEEAIYEKIVMARETGVDYFVFIKFTKSFSRMRAREFLEKIIYEKLGCRYLLVGYDWRFGYGREGEVELAEF